MRTMIRPSVSLPILTSGAGARRAELMAAALAEPAGEKPKLKPLVIPKPEVASRELPNGRGWLRVVGGKARPAAPRPGPATPPAAAVAVAAPVEPAAPLPASDSSPQLDLFAWKPRLAAPAQLSLFGVEIESER